MSRNGRIILQTTLLDHPVTKIVKLLTQKQYLQRNGYPITYYTCNDIVKLCKTANLKIQSMQKFSLGCQFLDNRLPPRWNYTLESLLEKPSEYIVTEAIYLVSK